MHRKYRITLYSNSYPIFCLPAPPPGVELSIIVAFTRMRDLLQVGVLTTGITTPDGARTAMRPTPTTLKLVSHLSLQSLLQWVDLTQLYYMRIALYVLQCIMKCNCLPSYDHTDVENVKNLLVVEYSSSGIIHSAHAVVKFRQWQL
jgi:hypothetical protein